MKQLTATQLTKLSRIERLHYTAGISRMRWERQCRIEQIPGVGFEDTWITHLAVAGRGFGKTRMGAEWIVDECVSMPGISAGILAPTFDHAIKVCVEGESGILSILPDRSVVKFREKDKQIIFANGSVITLYSSEHQRQLAGPQFQRFWIDEPADLSQLIHHSSSAWICEVLSTNTNLKTLRV